MLRAIFSLLLVIAGCHAQSQKAGKAAQEESKQLSQEMLSQLPRHWVHSHEEDSGDQMVFRPSTYTFPRSRGRQEFDLVPDGTLRATRPGPTDKRESSAGSWSLEPGGVLVIQPEGSDALRFSVVSVDNEKLVVKRP